MGCSGNRFRQSLQSWFLKNEPKIINFDKILQITLLTSEKSLHSDATKWKIIRKSRLYDFHIKFAILVGGSSIKKIFCNLEKCHNLPSALELLVEIPVLEEKKYESGCGLLNTRKKFQNYINVVEHAL